MLRFIGQNRPQFRAPTDEDPGQVKDLVDKLEKHQNPGVEDSVSYVRMELSRWIYYFCESYDVAIFLIINIYIMDISGCTHFVHVNPHQQVYQLSWL